MDLHMWASALLRYLSARPISKIKRFYNRVIRPGELGTLGNLNRQEMLETIAYFRRPFDIFGGFKDADVSNRD